MIGLERSVESGETWHPQGENGCGFGRHLAEEALGKRLLADNRNCKETLCDRELEDRRKILACISRVFDRCKTSCGDHLTEEAEGNRQEQVSNFNLSELFVLAIVHAKRECDRANGSGPFSKKLKQSSMASG